MRATRGLVLLICLALVAAMGLPLANFVGPLWLPRGDLATISAWLGVATGLVLYPCAVALDRRKLRGFMVSGIVLGIVGYVGWVRLIFALPRMRYGDWTSSVVLCTPPTTWAALMSFIAVLILMRAPYRWIRVVRRGTIVMGVMAAVYAAASIIIYVLNEQRWEWREEDAFIVTSWRIGGVIGILGASGLLVVIFASVAGRLSEQETPRAERREFDITCPRCGAVQRLLTDGDACAACGLRIKVTPT